MTNIVEIRAGKELENKMLIQDRRTGKWYDPDKQFKDLFTKDWFIAILRRMKFR